MITQVEGVGNQFLENGCQNVIISDKFCSIGTFSAWFLVGVWDVSLGTSGGSHSSQGRPGLDLGACVLWRQQRVPGGRVGGCAADPSHERLPQRILSGTFEGPIRSKSEDNTNLFFIQVSSFFV